MPEILRYRDSSNPLGIVINRADLAVFGSQFEITTADMGTNAATGTDEVCVYFWRSSQLSRAKELLSIDPLEGVYQSD